MDEHHVDNITSFLLSKRPSRIIKQLAPKQIDTLFEKLRSHNEHLTQLSRLDPLTQLPNRLCFDVSVKRLLAQVQRRQQKAALLCIDLDGFKEVNDTQGHAAGDLILKEVATTLMQNTRDEDLLARIGGDEFVLVLPCLDEYADAAHVAGKIIKAIKAIECPQLPGVSVGCSIGIAGFPVAADNAHDLFQAADKALYQVKDQGGGHFEYFSEKVKQEFRYTQKLIKTFRRNLLQNSFSLVYFPVFKASSSEIAGAQVRLPGMQEILLHLERIDGFYEKLSVGYIQKVFDNFQQWESQGIDTQELKLFVEVNRKMLMTDEFMTQLQQCFDSSPAFRDSCIISLVGMNSAVTKKTIFQSAVDINIPFCYPFDDSQQNNILQFRDIEPRYMGINLETIYSKALSSQRNTIFVKAIINFSRSLGAEIFISGINDESEKETVIASGTDYMSGSYLSPALSQKEIIPYLAKYYCHQH